MPGKQLSLDTRREMWRYLQTHPEADGLKLQQRFDLKSSTYRYLAKFSSSPDQATFCSGFRTGRCKKNSFGLDIKVARVLSGDCSLVLRGVKRKLRRLFGVKASVPTIRAALRRLGWTRKHTVNFNEGRCSGYTLDLRKAFAAQLAADEWEDDGLVYLDETGINLHCSSSFGWAPRGVRPMQIVPNQRGVNLSVICAVTSWGEILYRLHDGSVNGNKLQVFLEEVLIPRLAVWVPKPRLLLMDNVKFHHKPSVQQLFPVHQMSLKYLPPYSPELDPAELVFASLKAQIRRARPRPKTRVQMCNLTKTTLDNMNGKATQPLYNEMRRFLARAAAKKQFYD